MWVVISEKAKAESKSMKFSGETICFYFCSASGAPSARWFVTGVEILQDI